MSSPKLARKRAFLERGVFWWLLTGGAGLAALGLAAVTSTGLLHEYELFPALLRGYTPLGVLFGVGATAAAFVSFAYAFRRRWLQESLSLGRGTMAMWLAVHVAFGALALLLGCLHAGYGAVSLQPSTGKVLLALLVISALSGAFWRLLYAVLPAAAARKVGNYAAEETLSRANAQGVEIEKLAAGRSPALQALTRRVLETKIDAAEAGRAAAGLTPADSATFAEIARLASERHGALARAREQRRYAARLQAPRLLHVPLSLTFVVLVPLHVIFAYDLPERALAVDHQGAGLGGFESASSCKRCHAAIVDEWRASMHAHALGSPVMVAQANLAARTTLAAIPAPDPQNLCINCHGPIAARITPGASLPLAAPALGDPDLTSEGVGCLSCHANRGEPHTGGAALTAFQAGLAPGRTYFGPLEEPVGNAFHRSEPGPHFAAPERLCQNCHSVVYDRDGNGVIEKGKDLVLQDLFSEWQAYRSQGGAHCVDCHMPVSSATRAAESALIPFEQDEAAPPRRVRSHLFIGPDYPLDDPGIRDRGRAAREALLRGAATLSFEAGSGRVQDKQLGVDVRITNSGTGHNLPGGFSFLRQLWLELRVLDGAGRLLASSGVLAAPVDNLCDATALDPASSVRAFVQGCARVDPNLVNLQQQLLDKIELGKGEGNVPVLVPAAGSREVVVQHVTSGPVARIRPADGRPLTTLAPGQSRSYAYRFPLPENARPARIEARLLFRPLPPYFLRALAETQTAADGPKLSAWIPNLDIIEAAKVTANVLP